MSDLKPIYQKYYRRLNLIKMVNIIFVIFVLTYIFENVEKSSGVTYLSLFFGIVYSIYILIRSIRNLIAPFNQDTLKVAKGFVVDEAKGMFKTKRARRGMRYKPQLNLKSWALIFVIFGLLVLISMTLVTPSETNTSLIETVKICAFAFAAMHLIFWRLSIPPKELVDAHMDEIAKKPFLPPSNLVEDDD